MNAAQVKLAWYWNRLRSMSTPEMLHRLSEMAKRKASRSADVRLFDAGEGPLPGLATLRGRPVQPDEGLLQNWRDVFEAARHGRYVLLGMTWPGVAGPEKWHLDPVSGRAWAKDRYCFDISWRHERMLGDVKYTAELNRLQHLQPIAALAHATGDNAAARFCVAEIESWIDTNPPFLGIHWVSGIELALRVRALHLDDDLVAVGKSRGVNLADRGRRQGLRVEVGEHPLRTQPELLFDDPLDVGERLWVSLVLQAPQLGHDVRRNDVGSR